MFLTMVGIASSIIVLPVNILNILNSYETLPVLSDFKILVCWAFLQTVMVFGISLGTSVAFPLFIAIGLNLSHPFSIAIQFIQNNVSPQRYRNPYSLIRGSDDTGSRKNRIRLYISSQIQ